MSLSQKRADRIANAEYRGKVKGGYGTLQRAKSLYIQASQGFYVSRGFQFDLAIDCLKKAGFELEEYHEDT